MLTKRAFKLLMMGDFTKGRYLILVRSISSLCVYRILYTIRGEGNNVCPVWSSDSRRGLSSLRRVGSTWFNRSQINFHVNKTDSCCQCRSAERQALPQIWQCNTLNYMKRHCIVFVNNFWKYKFVCTNSVFGWKYCALHIFAKDTRGAHSRFHFCI